ncbi:MAG: TIGR02594 family protein [Moraxellaceae bacterium]|nr:TIGR02594 family protein [Moraxellaceae bacterium]
MTANIQNELPWLVEARKYIGQREIKGSKHNPLILKWLQKLKAWWLDDETPWCGVFVANCLLTTGREIPKHWYRATDYLNSGFALDKPAYGCIVVFSRTGGGHVGFVVGIDKYGYLMVLGGNQSDTVKISPFDKSRISGYRWPANAGGLLLKPHSYRYELPILESNGSLSSNEE